MKSSEPQFLLDAWCRSREGAWIEIQMDKGKADGTPGRSREGAWIEIPVSFTSKLYTARRSREGAWIEFAPSSSDTGVGAVAPARERGLKLLQQGGDDVRPMSLPRGSVD